MSLLTRVFSLRFAVLLALLFVVPLSFAQVSSCLVIKNFSNQRLMYLTNGNTPVDVGGLGTNANRVKYFGNGSADGWVMVVHSGSFTTGANSELWYVHETSFFTALNSQQPIPWQVRSFPNFSNPYDVALVNETAWVTLLGTSQVAVVNLNTNQIDTLLATGSNPQDILLAGQKVFISNSGFGNGNTVTRYDVSTLTRRDLTVGVNPQGLGSRSWGEVSAIYVANSGRSWETIPVPGSVSVLSTVDDSVRTLSTSGFSAFYPASVATTFDDVWFASEYSIPRYGVVSGLSVMPILSLTVGGWQIASNSDGQFTVLFSGSSSTDSVYMIDATRSISSRWNIGGVSASLAAIDHLVSAPEYANIPQSISLSPPFPNPFNATTKLQFSLPQGGDVKLSLYDANGRAVGDVLNGYAAPGAHVVRIGSQQLSSGQYYVRLSSGKLVQTQAITVIK